MVGDPERASEVEERVRSLESPEATVLAVGEEYASIYEIVIASPPVTSWGTLVRLGVLSQLDLEALGHNSTAYLHRYAKITKRAYSERIKFARDLDISPTPLDQLLSREYWADEAARVDTTRATPYRPSTDLKFLSFSG